MDEKGKRWESVTAPATVSDDGPARAPLECAYAQLCVPKYGLSAVCRMSTGKAAGCQESQVRRPASSSETFGGKE